VAVEVPELPRPLGNRPECPLCGFLAGSSASSVARP
jgi:hypothetical protein